MDRCPVCHNLVGPTSRCATCGASLVDRAVAPALVPTELPKAPAPDRRARAYRALGIALVVAGAAFPVIALAHEVDVARGAGSVASRPVGALVLVLIATPALLGALLAIRPDMAAIVAPIGLLAWGPVVVAIPSALASLSSATPHSGVAKTAVLVMAAVSMFVAAAVAARVAPERRAGAILAGIAAALWCVPVGLALRAMPVELGFDVARWIPRAVHAASCAIAAGVAVSLAAERAPARRQRLALVGLAFLPVVVWSTLIAEDRSFAITAEWAGRAAWVVYGSLLRAVPFVVVVLISAGSPHAPARDES